MPEFIRKIVYFKVLEKERFSTKQGNCFYKVEKRNNDCKINVTFDGLKKSTEIKYELWMLTKKIELLSSVEIEPNIQYIKTFQITFDLNEMKALFLTWNHKIIMVGFYKDEQPIYEVIDQFEKHNQINNQVDQEKMHNNIAGQKTEGQNIAGQNTEGQKIVDQKTADQIIENKNLEKQKHENQNIEEKQKINEQKFDQAQSTNDKPIQLNPLEWIKKELNRRKEETRIEKLFNDKMRIQPFFKMNDEEEWIQINLSDLIFLPIEVWMLNNNSFLLNAYRVHKHLILGRNLNRGVLRLGIPGNSEPEEKYLANICDFKIFAPCEESLIRQRLNGYWMIETKI